MRNMRLKALDIEGKLACEVKVRAADMNNLQAVIESHRAGPEI